jgi:4-hydroxy-3-polyprenylbenzoate decarboxylase
MTSKTPRRLVIGISGASGTIYGVRMLELLKKTDIETHLVMSKSAEMTLVYETKYKPKDVRALASVNHPAADIGASISSGSFATMGMIIIPCSIRTMSEIATGVTSSLVSRAADVVLKEQRRLVLAVRETPLHVGHLRTLTTLAEIGAVVAPIVPAFYSKPKDRGRHHQSHRRPSARLLRHRDQAGETLGRRTGGRLKTINGRISWIRKPTTSA